jgi:hypothetical protein
MINSFSSQELAVGYTEDRAEFAPELIVGKLAYGVPIVPLPVGLKARLFDDVAAADVDRLSSRTDEVHYPKPPRLNRSIEGNIRDITVRGKPR